ncbi:hypothetical protein V9T40_013372 [Parthenolecanium corni]
MESTTGNCDSAFSFCGVRDRRYPDKKAMGFPFDRTARTGVVTLNQFLTPNMKVQDIRIRFSERTTDGRTLQAAQNKSKQANQTQSKSGASSTTRKN